MTEIFREFLLNSSRRLDAFCATPTATKIAAANRPGYTLYGQLALLNLIFDHSFIPQQHLRYDKPILPMHCRSLINNT